MQYTGFTDGSELKIEGRSPPTSPRIHTLSDGEVEALVDRMYVLNLELKESVTSFMLSTKNMGDLREVRDLRDEDFRMSPATIVCTQECKKSTVRARGALAPDIGARAARLSLSLEPCLVSSILVNSGEFLQILVHTSKFW